MLRQLLNLRKLVILAFAAGVLISPVVHAEDPGGAIHFDIIGLQDDQNYTTVFPSVNLEFSLNNQSTGSIYSISVRVDVWDDRGDQMEPQLGSIVLSTDEFWSGSDIVIPQGETVNILQQRGAKGRCKYLSEVAVTGVDPKNCNIRNLPEEANCLEMVRLTSSVESVKIRPR